MQKPWTTAESRGGARKMQVSLEHPAVPESKEMHKNQNEPCQMDRGAKGKSSQRPTLEQVKQQNE